MKIFLLLGLILISTGYKAFALPSYLQVSDFASNYNFARTLHMNRDWEDLADPQIQEDLSRFHFVFVGGFANELAPSYFDHNVKTARDLGAGYVSVLRPSSLSSARNNLPWLKTEIERLFF